MNRLNFSHGLLFDNLAETGPGGDQVAQSKRDLCRDAMLGLIERYQLAGKSVLSLGCGESFEEFWFHDNGCSLTLNDIDLHFDPEGCQGTGLIFYHGDAGAALADIEDGQFDLLYVSSFHPDEIRREEIQAEFATRRSPEQAYHHVTWPEDEMPYHETLHAALSKVRDGGLAIFQHYRGGVYIDSNPHYLDAIEKQFQSMGVRLLEVYVFRRSTAHLLVVGYKGDAAPALELSKALKARPEIKTFHGRYGDKDISTDVLNVFELADEQIRPRKVFAIPPNSSSGTRRTVTTSA